MYSKVRIIYYKIIVFFCFIIWKLFYKVHQKIALLNANESLGKDNCFDFPRPSKYFLIQTLATVFHAIKNPRTQKFRMN